MAYKTNTHDNLENYSSLQISMAENQNYLTNFSVCPSGEAKIKLSTLSADTSSQAGRHDLHIRTFLLILTVRTKWITRSSYN